MHTNLLLLLLIFFTFPSAWAGSYTQALLKKNLVRVSPAACSEIENKLGQLFYINVDGNGTPPPHAIDPEYIRLVKELQVGGVLPHFKVSNSQYVSLDSMKDSTSSLQNATELPLMIGVDYLWIKKAKEVKSPEDLLGYMGLGYGRGSLDPQRSNQCLRNKGQVEGLIHRTAGVNQALGPTVDVSSLWGEKNFGPEILAHKGSELIDAYNGVEVETVLKHYPYTPDDFNLHTKIGDATISSEDLERRLKVFDLLKTRAPFVMTTHTFNRNVDPDNVATFSPTWASMLRKQVGANTIIMTDALYMIKGIGEEEIVDSMYKHWNVEQNASIKDKYSVYAIRSILAGHDMAFLEGTATQTRTVFRNSLQYACSDKPDSKRFRERIVESYDRIRRYKLANSNLLRRIPKVSLETQQKLFALYWRTASAQTCGDTALTKEISDLYKVILPSLTSPAASAAADEARAYDAR